MTPRRRLSNAIRRAVAATNADREAQAELHDAFSHVYGFDLDIEELGGDELVDVLTYGYSGTPLIRDIDRMVKELKERQSNEAE